MQGRIPIAYLSKALGPKSLGLSTYEKDFLALLEAYVDCPETMNKPFLPY